MIVTRAELASFNLGIGIKYLFFTKPMPQWKQKRDTWG